MSLEGIDLDEVGPPPIEIGMTLADVVRKVNAAGASLDQVVVAGTEEIYLDWAKNWFLGEELSEEERELSRDELVRRRDDENAEKEREERERQELEAEREAVANDPTLGW